MPKLCNFWVMYRFNFFLVVHTQTIHKLPMSKLSTNSIYYVVVRGRLWSCVVMRLLVKPIIIIEDLYIIRPYNYIYAYKSVIS